MVRAFISPHWCLEKKIIILNLRSYYSIFHIQLPNDFTNKPEHLKEKKNEAQEGITSGLKLHEHVICVSPCPTAETCTDVTLPAGPNHKRAPGAPPAALLQAEMGQNHCHPGKSGPSISVEIQPTWSLKCKNYDSHLYNESSWSDDHHWQMKHATEIKILICSYTTSSINGICCHTRHLTSAYLCWQTVVSRPGFRPQPCFKVSS